MSVKRFLAAVAATFIACVTVFSQDDRNPIIMASMNNLQYNHKKADRRPGTVIGEIATAVLTGQSSKDMEGYQNAVRSAILKGMTEAYRLHVVDGPLTKEEAETIGAIYVDGTLNNISTTTKNEVVEYEEKNQACGRSLFNDSCPGDCHSSPFGASRWPKVKPDRRARTKSKDFMMIIYRSPQSVPIPRQERS